jgi:hypothetical protein
VGVVDVQAGAVGEDDVGQPEIVVGELAGIGLGMSKPRASRSGLSTS